MKNDTYRQQFKSQTAKSLEKFRSEPIDQRVNKLSKQLTTGYRPIKQVPSHTLQIKKETKNQDLLKKVKTLEGQLKRKISQDGVVRNFFKTMNNSNMSHIDIYLQLKKLQEIILPLQSKLKEQAEREESLNKEIHSLRSSFQQKQHDHLENIIQLTYQLEEKQQEWRSQKHHLRDEAQKYKNQVENFKILIEQIKKKNFDLRDRNKTLAEELEIEREAKELQILKEREDFNKERQSIKNDLQDCKRQRNDLINQLQHNYLPKIEYFQEKQCFLDQIEKYELRIRQFEDMKIDFDIKQSEIRQECARSINAQMTRIQKSLDAQKIKISESYQQKLTQANNRIKVGSNQNTILQQLIRKMQEKQHELSQQMELRSMKVKSLEQQCFNLSQQNIELSNSLRRKGFEVDEKESLYIKHKSEMAQKQRQIQKMEKKISELSKNNDILVKKCQQTKRQIDYTKTFDKLNEKIHNQNYKSLGRLIEINKKISNLLTEYQIQFNQPKIEQSLPDTVSYSAQLINTLLTLLPKEKEKSEYISRQRNIQLRQLCGVIDQLKRFIGNQTIEQMIEQYLELIKNRKDTAKERSETIEIQHQIIQNLICLYNSKYVKVQHSSIESIYLPRIESIKKQHIHVQKQNIPINNVHKTKYQQYNLPLKLKINKESMESIGNMGNLNRLGQQIQSKIHSNHRQSVPKIKQIKQENLRSEVQRKYFRN